MDLRPVDEPAGEVAERADEADAAAAQDADAERVAALRVLDDDLVDALLVEEPAKLEVDRAGRQLARVEGRDAVLDDRDARRLGDGLGEPARVVRDLPLAYRCHTRTSRSYGSYVSISWSTSWRIAISSDASATRSSDS